MNISPCIIVGLLAKSMSLLILLTASNSYNYVSIGVKMREVLIKYTEYYVRLKYHHIAMQMA